MSKVPVPVRKVPVPVRSLNENGMLVPEQQSDQFLDFVRYQVGTCLNNRL